MKINKKSISYKIFPRFLGSIDKHNKNIIFQEIIIKKSKKAKVFSKGQRLEYFNFIFKDVIGDQPIDYLEFGVFKGESIKYWSKLNKSPKSRFYGFDTFTGLPEDWKRHPRGTFDTEGNIPKIDDTRVHFIKGLFQETLYDFLRTFSPQSRLVIHLDADLYSSTLFCLAQLDRIFNPGSLILFDEFYDLQNEFSAFYDYIRSHNSKFKIIARIGWSQVAIELE